VVTVAVVLAWVGPVVALVAAWRLEDSIDATRDIEIGAAVRRFWRLHLAAALWIAAVSAPVGGLGAGVALGVVYLLAMIAWSLHGGDGMVRTPFDSPVYHSLSGPVDTWTLHVDLDELTGRTKDRRTAARHLAVTPPRPPGIIKSLFFWLPDIRRRRRGD